MRYILSALLLASGAAIAAAGYAALQTMPLNLPAEFSPPQAYAVGMLAIGALATVSAFLMAAE